MCEKTKLVPIPDSMRADYADVFEQGDAGPGREFDTDAEGRWCFAMDECIVPAVEALWAAGVETLGCCCGHGSGHGVVSIRTTTAEGADPVESARGYYQRLAAMRPEPFL